MTLEAYLQQHYTKETAKAYAREIAIYCSNYPGAVTAVYRDVTSYIGSLRKRYNKAATINRILSSIKVYYDYLCAARIRSDNPAASILLKDQRSRDIQLQDLFTTEELGTLLESKERYSQLGYRNKVLVGLLIYQALHPQEIAALQVQDVNLDTGSIYIRPTAKTNSRELSLRPNQVLLFYHYLQEVRNKLLKGRCNDSLLLGLRGESMTASDISKHVKRTYEGMYGSRVVNAQTIRQSVIANLLKLGHDISVVQMFAGHKYPSSTQQYQQDEIETLKAAIHKYHPVK